jgi:hypothetical protein
MNIKRRLPSKLHVPLSYYHPSLFTQQSMLPLLQMKLIQQLASIAVDRTTGYLLIGILQLFILHAL